VGLLSSQEQNNIEENSKKSRSPFFEKYQQKKNYEKNYVKIKKSKEGIKK